MLAAFFFILHTSHPECVPYVYSGFAAMEYTVVASNIIFNWAMTYSLPGNTVLLIATTPHLIQEPDTQLHQV